MALAAASGAHRIALGFTCLAALADMSLRRLDSADQWQSYQSGPVQRPVRSLVWFRLAGPRQVGSSIKSGRPPRRTRSRSQHTTV